MKAATWPVKAGDARIIRLTADEFEERDPEGRCSHCPAKLGEEHAAQCVKRVRTVVVRTIIEHVIRVPETWDPGMVEFHRDGSSWCASNVADEIVKLAERGCICGQMTAEFVREATEEDEARDGVTVGGES